MRVLVVVAHPDDEVLGVGGTMLKHSKNNDFVKVIYLATGISSRDKLNKKNSIKKEINSLRLDAKKSCKILNVAKTEFYDLPDNKMDSIPLLDIVKIIENEIKKEKPDRIYTHHYGDLNIDHRLTYNACLTACRPISKKTPELICFEVASSTEWNYPYSFNPNYFINIDKYIDKKIQAMKMYKNEIREFPHPRSAENLEKISARWGSVSGTKHAEAFEIIRKIE
jgi:LmbE family N-acetylglucosaminyl deacetylase